VLRHRGRRLLTLAAAAPASAASSPQGTAAALTGVLGALDSGD